MFHFRWDMYGINSSKGNELKYTAEGETFNKGMLKKATSSVPCLRRASFAEVATEAESGYAFTR